MDLDHVTVLTKCARFPIQIHLKGKEIPSVNIDSGVMSSTFVVNMSILQIQEQSVVSIKPPQSTMEPRNRIEWRNS